VSPKLEATTEVFSCFGILGIPCIAMGFVWGWLARLCKSGSFLRLGIPQETEVVEST
jgi:hypothetical protein